MQIRFRNPWWVVAGSVTGLAPQALRRRELLF